MVFSNLRRGRLDVSDEECPAVTVRVNLSWVMVAACQENNRFGAVGENLDLHLKHRWVVEQRRGAGKYMVFEITIQIFVKGMGPWVY